MLIIPAIDLKEGQCVRLRQGIMNDATIFSDDPAKMARQWVVQGARRLHLVDLDGAVEGKPVNSSAIESILAEVGGKVELQLGGGIRDLETLEHYFSKGVSYIILGTAAVKDPLFVKKSCQLFGGRILVGIDAKDGRVSVEGWAKQTSQTVLDLAKQYEDFGVEAIIYTDINRDGMGSGINVPSTKLLAQSINLPVIASGGLSSLDDVRMLRKCEKEGVFGAITGRALYEGTLNLREAQELSDQLSKAQEWD